jgi:hypothetical protein
MKTNSTVPALNYVATSAITVDVDLVMTVPIPMKLDLLLVNLPVLLQLVNVVNHVYQVYATISVMKDHVNLVMNVDSSMVMRMHVISIPSVHPEKQLVHATNSKNLAIVNMVMNADSLTKLLQPLPKAQPRLLSNEDKVMNEE